MQRKRLVYTSLSNQRPQPIQQVQQKPRSRNRKKRPKNPLNQHLRNAARVYLHQVKFVSKDEIFTILKSNNYLTKQTTHTSKKLPNDNDIENKGVKDSYPQIKFQELEIANYLSRKRYNKINRQNQMYESFKSRYDIRESSNTQPDRRRYLGTSQGSRQISNLKSSERQHKIGSDYLQKMQERKRKKSKKQSKTAANNINQTIKVYLSNKQSISQKKKVRKQAVTSAADVYEHNKQSHIRLVSQESKSSAPQLNTIESRQKLIARNIRGFVINEKDQIVSQILRARGWKCFGEHSQKYTLKWTYNENFKDYQLVRNAYRTNRHMYFNHIKNNKLVNKADFFSLSKKLQQKGINISQFIPQTFIISTQKHQFLQNYNTRIILSSLQKHISYFTLKNIKQNLHQHHQYTHFHNMNDICNYLVNIDGLNICQQLIDQNQCENVLVNVPMVYNILVLSCYYLMLYEDIVDEKFMNRYAGLCNDGSVVNALVVFNRADLPFEEYSRFRSTEKKRINNNTSNKTKQFSIVNGYLKATKTFMTPSKKLIQAIFFCKQYLAVRLHEYLKGGLRNYWIIKPCAGSKGCGIQIIDRVEKVNHSFQSSSNKMVQKYIEDIWTVRQEDIGDSNRQKFQKLLNKKFDIRQWVLINPPNSYIFSSFYVRICSKQYDFDSNDPRSHLSNFSINRDNFQKYEDSVFSEEQFSQLMQLLNRKSQYTKMRKQLRQRIKLLTDQAIIQCQHIPGTFEIVGFDILIDSQFNPWVIQCNMSPACNIRTDWLKQMKGDMISGALELILDSSVYQNSQQIKRKYNWEHLSKVKMVGDKDIRQSREDGTSSPVNMARASGNIFKSYKRKNLSQMQDRVQNVL